MTVDEPTVTVIVPTLDRPDALAAAIDSALDQTHRPLEIIVIDDGSDPPAQVGPGIRLLRTEEPAGPAAARNRAAAEARGELLAFLDDDDRWRPEKLELQVAALAEARAAAVFSGWELREGETVLAVVVPPPAEGLRDRLLRDPTVVPSALLLRTEVFRSLGGFDAALRFGEDWDLALRLVERHRVATVPEILVERQAHPHRRYGPRLVTDHRELMRRLTPRLRDLGPGERARVRSRHLLRLAQYGLRWALEPVVVGRAPWRARQALRRRAGARRP